MLTITTYVERKEENEGEKIRILLSAVRVCAVT